VGLPLGVAYRARPLARVSHQVPAAAADRPALPASFALGDPRGSAEGMGPRSGRLFACRGPARDRGGRLFGRAPALGFARRIILPDNGPRRASESFPSREEPPGSHHREGRKVGRADSAGRTDNGRKSCRPPRRSASGRPLPVGDLSAARQRKDRRHDGRSREAERRRAPRTGSSYARRSPTGNDRPGARSQSRAGSLRPPCPSD